MKLDRSNYHLGFTLFELLTVITIIAVLLSLMLPLIERVRESARSARCLGQMRQMGLAFGAYAQDNRGLWPYDNDVGIGGSNGFSIHFTGQNFRVYMTDGVVTGSNLNQPYLRCPSRGNSKNSSVKISWISYSCAPNRTGNKRGLVGPARISNPSSTILLIDSQYFGYPFWLDKLDRPFWWKDGAPYSVTVPSASGEYPMLDNRHRDGANLMMADLSARWQQRLDSDADYKLQYRTALQR
jgi:prepilin-type N-terminal cleavage/methylation domain-containing protein